MYKLGSLLGVAAMMITSQMHSQPRQQWVARLDGSGTDFPNAIAVDKAGNSYITGESNSVVSRPGIVTIKYNSSGQQQWLHRYESSVGPGPDIGLEIVTDDSGNVFVGGREGRSGPSFPGPSFLVLKYNATGTFLWSARYAGNATRGNNFVQGLGVDRQGNVYVTGQSEGSNFTIDIATVKYNAAGQQQWAARFNGPANGIDEAVELIVNDSGFVYVAGKLPSSSGVTAKYGLIKYNPANGDTLWTRGYQASTIYNESVADIAIDAQGNIGVGGWFMTSSTARADYWVEVYNAQGGLLWRNTYGGPNNTSDFLKGVEFDGDGNVIVAGYQTFPGTLGITVVKYSPNGIQQWVNARDSVHMLGQARDRVLALDHRGNAYVLAYVNVPQRQRDWATISVSTGGSYGGLATYGEEGSADDTPTRIVSDTAGNIYAMGYSHHIGTTTNWDYALVKYVPNRAPVIHSQADTTSIVGQLYEYVVTATDLDGDTLVFRLAVAPQWLSIDTLTGRISGTPAHVGDTTVTVVVNDRHFGESSQTYSLHVVSSTDVVSKTSAPNQFALGQNYPNPFNPSTSIHFEIPKSGFVSLKVFDILGREVALLVNEERSPGRYSIQWDATNFGSGTYFCRLESDGRRAIKKMLLMK